MPTATQPNSMKSNLLVCMEPAENTVLHQLRQVQTKNVPTKQAAASMHGRPAQPGAAYQS
jgi:hypothetical protein